MYGPGQRPDMAFHRFFESVISGTPVNIFGDGDQRRDFTYVDDIVEANFLAMTADSASKGRKFTMSVEERMPRSMKFWILSARFVSSQYRWCAFQVFQVT